MRSPHVCLPLLFALSGALAARADEPWRNKPYTEWNEKEVREILEKSPWAHRQSLMLVKPSPQAPCNARGRGCSTDDSVILPRTSGPRQGQILTKEPGAAQNPHGPPDMTPAPEGVSGAAVVRWASAQTVREALARSGMKGEKVATTEALESAPLPPSDAYYIVYVDLRVHLSDVKKVPQSGVFTPAMAQNSTLLVKRTGERISPLRVTAAPLPEFDDRRELALAAYYVYFPRQKDGKLVFTEKEGVVRFECPLTPLPIRAEFDLRDMRRGGVPDL